MAQPKQTELEALEERKQATLAAPPEDRQRILAEVWKAQQERLKDPNKQLIGHLGAIATAASPRFAAYTARRRAEAAERAEAKKIAAGRRKVKAQSNRLTQTKQEYDAERARINAERVARGLDPL